MINIDELYKQVSNPNITRDEIDQIIDTIEHGTSFDNTYHNELKLFVKIASLPLSDPALVVRMYHVLKLVYTISPVDFKRYSELLDYGSKVEFDKIWYNDNIQIKILDSKHCYGNQLQEFFDREVKSKNGRTMGIIWVKSMFDRLLNNPNCPDDIQLQAIKRFGEYFMPIIVTKIALSKEVLAHIKHYISYRDDDGKIFNNFVSSSKLSWKQISDIITFDYFFISDNYTKTLNRLGDSRFATFKVFCKRDDCPNEVKMQWFEWTDDVEFLPKDAKDIFVF